MAPLASTKEPSDRGGRVSHLAVTGSWRESTRTQTPRKMTPAGRECPQIVVFLLASGASRRNKATLAAIKPLAVIGFIAIMPGAKFLSGSICRIHPVRTAVAIAAVRRLAATGAIWVIGAFKRI